MAFANAIPETVLVLDDEEDFVTLTTGVLQRAGFDPLAATSTMQARARLDQNFVDLMLVDERLGRESGTRFLGEMRQRHPGLPAIVISADANLHLAQQAMRFGAVDILAKPLLEQDLIDSLRRALESTDLVREARRNRWVSQRTVRPPEIVGNSRAIREALETIALVAATDATVLIQGESGTGKELFAKAIHAASPRRHKLMRSLNMSAISQEIIEAELFGAVKGSYTGATVDRNGYFLDAEGSTLFLDEIGDASASVQVKLLRALEAGAVTRVGETKARRIDVRVVAATNRDLQKEVKAGKFREDLFYRLNVVPITIPPLRERPEDIVPIAKHMLKHYSEAYGRSLKGFDESALRVLRRQTWPGNARDLRNVIQRSVLLSNVEVLSAAEIRLDLIDHAPAEWQELLELPLVEAELGFYYRYFQRLMQRANSSKTKAAALADCDRKTIYTYLEKLGLDK